MTAKLLILTLFLVLSLITYHVSPTFAQAQTPLEKAQSDYNFQYTKYKDAQEKYITAKAAYISFNTAVSKNNAFVETKNYLTQIDQLYLIYILHLVENANALNWEKSPIGKDTAVNLLNLETTYITEHKQKVQNTKTLEELPPLAEELKVHIEDTFEERTNRVLATLEIVESQSMLEEFNSLSAILDRIVVFKLRAGETKSILANWASEIKDIRNDTNTKIQEALDTLAEQTDEGLRESALDEIADTAQDAQTELKRSKPLFEELARIL